MTEVKAKSKTEAVIKAITDEIRTRKKEKIKAMAGKMEFTATADELRHKEDIIMPARHRRAISGTYSYEGKKGGRSFSGYPSVFQILSL
ncbi:MAG: hypothetical protein AABY42_02415 [Nitrospirota bacterium]